MSDTTPEIHMKFQEIFHTRLNNYQKKEKSQTTNLSALQ